MNPYKYNRYNCTHATLCHYDKYDSMLKNKVIICLKNSESIYISSILPNKEEGNGTLATENSMVSTTEGEIPLSLPVLSTINLKIEAEMSNVLSLDISIFPILTRTNFLHNIIVNKAKQAS